MMQPKETIKIRPYHTIPSEIGQKVKISVYFLELAETVFTLNIFTGPEFI